MGLHSLAQSSEADDGEGFFAVFGEWLVTALLWTVGIAVAFALIFALVLGVMLGGIRAVRWAWGGREDPDA